jgi:flagellar transcriptional activator FlhC
MSGLPPQLKVRTKSVVGDAREVSRAVELIRMGARLQVLESEIALSRERLLRLYKEVAGVSPSKGMLPFSTDWFMTWQPNIHSSLFINLFLAVSKAKGIDRVDSLVRAFRLYQEHLQLCGLPEVLSITRAWRLIKFFEAEMLDSAACTHCGGRFVVHKYEPVGEFVCGLCNPPARAGKTRSAALQLSARLNLTEPIAAADVIV